MTPIIGIFCLLQSRAFPILNLNNGGGNRPPNGPPDLEELWQDFNRRLNGLFGNGDSKNKETNNNRPPNFNEPPQKVIRIGFGAIAFILCALWLLSGIYIVDTSERGVVTRFGKYYETTEPGLRWRFPAPIDAHELVNLSGVRIVEIGYRGSEKNKNLKEALMLTDDENITNIQFAVQYVLKDPVQFLFENRHPEEAVKQAAETAVREIVGRSKMDFVLYEGREQVASEASKLMQDILDRYKTGILISKVTMQNAQPPEEVQEAFNDAVKAGQDKERQKNEGQAYANDVIPRAQGTASRLMQEAEGYKQRLIATAEGDASRFKQLNAEYTKAPEVTRQRLYTERMQQVYSSVTKVVADSKQNSLLYLPLDKLIKESDRTTASATETNGGSSNGSTPSDTSNKMTEALKSRDALRSREREGR